MNDLVPKIEAVLFAQGKGMTLNSLVKICKCTADEAKGALLELRERLNQPGSGIHLIENGEVYQLVTSPNLLEVEDLAAKAEAGDLTPAALETLTIVAYRGPILRSQIEAIRGVNCAVTLRNLSIRGLVDEVDSALELEPGFVISTDALRFLGVHSVKELPDYEKFNQHEDINRLIGRE